MANSATSQNNAIIERPAAAPDRDAARTEKLAIVIALVHDKHAGAFRRLAR